MASNELTRILADLVRQQSMLGSKPNPQQVNVLSQSLLNQRVDPYDSGRVLQEDLRGPSVINRILDIMSRPLYGVANVMKTRIENADAVRTGELTGRDIFNLTLRGPATDPKQISAFWRGISGQDKTTGSDVLDTAIEATGIDTDVPGAGLAKGATSFALDVLMDPLTYVGVGTVRHLGRGIARSVSALSGAEAASGAAAKELADSISRRAASEAAEFASRVPRPERRIIDRETRRIRVLPQDPPRTFIAGPGVSSPPRIPSGTPALPSSVINRPALPPGPTDDITHLTSRGSAAVAGVGDTIATPIPKPQTVRELLESVLTDSQRTGPNWQRLVQRQVGHIGEIDPARQTLNPLSVFRALTAYRDVTKSPVIRNMIDQQLDKLRAGIMPAELLNAASVAPIVFPKITLPAGRRAAAEAIADNFAKKYPQIQIDNATQAKLFKDIQRWVNRNVRPNRRLNVLYQMIRVAENQLLRSGRKLVDNNGNLTRLSDVINVAGGARAISDRLIDNFAKSVPSQAKEIATAVASKETAEKIIDPVISTGKTLADQVSHLPPSRTVSIGSEISRALARVADEAGAASKDAKLAKEFIEKLFNPKFDALYDATTNQAREMMRIAMTGKNNPQAIHAFGKKIYESLGANPKILGKTPVQSKVVEGIMTRFATWWNAKDLRPFAREYIDTARNVAAAFAHAMTPLVRSTTKTQRYEAFRIAQGRMTPGNPAEQELAERFTYLIERLLGTHGINNSESIVHRSGVTMQELNKELPEHLRFVDVAGLDGTGRSFNYTNGQWMHSWKEWDIQDPAEALYELTRALQLVTRKNAFLDDAASRWGMPTRTREFQHGVTIPRLQGFYFPKQIADQLQAVWNRLETDKFKPGGTFMQHIDRIQRAWKTGVTIYSPSHHIRNLNGDIFMSALDGVTSIKPYYKAAQVLHAFKGRYKDLENVFEIMDPKLKDMALKARTGNIIVQTKSGHRITAEQLMMAAEAQGILTRASVLEDLVGGSPTAAWGSRFSPFKGRVHQMAAGVSELRDHYVRLAHFIDVLSKTKAKDLRSAFEEAGRRVKKWHPDGSDLTGFEQNVMRRLIPFYSWLRKATPLVIEGAAMRPHITLAFPRAMANLQEVTGIETEGPANPFPMDQMFPEWIREKGIGPIIPPDHPLAGIGRQATWQGDTPGYVVVNPTNPFMDQIIELSNPKQTVLSSLSPFLRVPVELLTGQTSLGVPLENIEGGTAGYLAQQVPAVGIGARITGMTRPDEPYQPEQLINWLTGMGVTGTGPYQAQARYEISELRQALGRAAREAMQ